MVLLDLHWNLSLSSLSVFVNQINFLFSLFFFDNCTYVKGSLSSEHSYSTVLKNKYFIANLLVYFLKKFLDIKGNIFSRYTRTFSFQQITS